MVPWTQARARPGRSAPLVRFWPVLRIASMQMHRFLVFRNSPSFQARWAFACVRVCPCVFGRAGGCFPSRPRLPSPCPAAGACPAPCYVSSSSRTLSKPLLCRRSGGLAAFQLPPSRGGGLGSHRYAGAAPGASSHPAPPVCASAAAVGAHGPAPSLGPCRACLVPFITTLTNPSRA